MIYNYLIAILVLSFAPHAWAQLDGEECDPNAIYTECIGEDDGSAPPLPPPTDNEGPPTTTPPEQLLSLSETYVEINKLVDWYLLQVFGDLGHPDASIQSIESQLLAAAVSEAATQSSYDSFDTDDERILYMKMRILKANHPEFAADGGLPPTLVALVEHASELDDLENNLILVTP